MRRACARSRAACCSPFPASSVREIAESEICCGSAGIYNLLEPDAATELRDRKVRNILKTDAEVIVSGNPGCLLQIATGLEAAGRPMRIMHLVEVLDQSIRKVTCRCSRRKARCVRCDRCVVGPVSRPAALVTIAAWVYTISQRRVHVFGDAHARRVVDVDGLDEHGQPVAGRARRRCFSSCGR